MPKIAGFKQNDVFEPIICREPKYCTEDVQPKPTVESGLEVSNSTPSIGVPEFSYLSFNCKESKYVMYKPPSFTEKFAEDYKFEVMIFINGLSWIRYLVNHYVSVI